MRAREAENEIITRWSVTRSSVLADRRLVLEWLSYFYRTSRTTLKRKKKKYTTEIERALSPYQRKQNQGQRSKQYGYVLATRSPIVNLHSYVLLLNERKKRATSLIASFTYGRVKVSFYFFLFLSFLFLFSFFFLSLYAISRRRRVNRGTSINPTGFRAKEFTREDLSRSVSRARRRPPPHGGRERGRK